MLIWLFSVPVKSTRYFHFIKLPIFHNFNFQTLIDFDSKIHQIPPNNGSCILDLIIALWVRRNPSYFSSRAYFYLSRERLKIETGMKKKHRLEIALANKVKPFFNLYGALIMKLGFIYMSRKMCNERRFFLVAASK